MAVYSTPENGKDEYLSRTLRSLKDTVDFSRHRLMLSVNAATEHTIELIEAYEPILENVFYNSSNLGTAEAINLAWRLRNPGEHAVKMDDDIVIHREGWLDELEEAVSRQPRIGQAGLKRKDCIESPDRPEHDFYRSKLVMLPHQNGDKWIVVEEVNHVMGSCVLHSSDLLDKVGYLYQLGPYGFDDSFMSLRCKLAGFHSVFLPHIEIEHIDPGVTPYQKWKEQQASSVWGLYSETVVGYRSGEKSIYYNPFSNE